MTNLLGLGVGIVSFFSVLFCTLLYFGLLIGFAVAYPMYGWTWLALNVWAWTKAIQALRKWNTKQFPKDSDCLQNGLPSALD